MQWPISQSEFEYVPVTETEVYCSTGMLMDPDDGRKSVRVFVSVLDLMEQLDALAQCNLLVNGCCSCKYACAFAYVLDMNHWYSAFGL